MLEGVLVVDKPSGVTSHDVVARLRRVTGEQRIGHAGTLDPLATGVLPLVLGRATRLVRFLPGDPKLYRTRARLGLETTTGDADGDPIGPPRSCAHVSEAAIAAELAVLTGEIDQIPPMFSAKKVSGERLYAAARRGIDVERRPARVRVDVFRLAARDGDRLDLEVRCSPGTYVRSLVSELGRRLGTGAMVESLRRIRSGAFAIEQSRPLDLLDAEAVAFCLIPLQAMPLTLPAVRVSPASESWLRHGKPFAADLKLLAEPPEGKVAVYSEDGRLLGVAEVHFAPPGPPLLHPRVVLE